MQTINTLRRRLANNEVISVAVNSTNLATWAYSPKTQVMTILFNRTNIYQYENVPVEVAYKMLDVLEKNQSTGKAFRALILNQYRFSRLNPDGSIEYTGK